MEDDKKETQKETEKQEDKQEETHDCKGYIEELLKQIEEAKVSNEDSTKTIEELKTKLEEMENELTSTKSEALKKELLSKEGLSPELTSFIPNGNEEEVKAAIQSLKKAIGRKKDDKYIKDNDENQDSTVEGYLAQIGN